VEETTESSDVYVNEFEDVSEDIGGVMHSTREGQETSMLFVALRAVGPAVIVANRERRLI
jgi:hypothetical protein